MKIITILTIILFFLDYLINNLVTNFIFLIILTIFCIYIANEIAYWVFSNVLDPNWEIKAEKYGWREKF
jgi:hypothetical protein